MLMPRLENLLVFGCRAEAYVESKRRKKGDDRSRPGLFVGYDEACRAYKFLPFGSRQWVTVRSLTCDEQNVGKMTEELEEEGWELVPAEIKGQQEGDKIVAESKQPEKQVLVAIKDTKRLTRYQLRIQRGKDLEKSQVAMVGVGSVEEEHYVPGEMIDFGVPRNIAEAFSGTEAEKWKKAVQEEMDSVIAAGTLSEPVELPEGAKATGLKFIFVKKVGENGEVNRFKARLVYNHYGPGEMGEDNYAPVANRISLRIFLTAVASNKWELIQADVKTAFLNADNPGRELVKLPKEVVNSEGERVRILQ